MLVLLDNALFVFHALWIAFNMTGWAFRRTRLLHLATMAATACSWFVLGAFYGWEYCLCTDWHFQIRRQLGYRDEATNYIQLLAKPVGLSLTAAQSEWIAWIVFVLILAAMAVAWTRAALRRAAAAVHGRQ
jgi:hypothetical protein